ncbi:unnamed protein product [Heligmosomoides polygyrus]|uniref:Uncharacterized protein n=1 Tax=Heligmosomoides polygyrus TaxID=6339 RepID=A0A183GJ15_HELPZ|nr:unnamed protein product [Heligmosomoides polygyrus]
MVISAAGPSQYHRSVLTGFEGITDVNGGLKRSIATPGSRRRAMINVALYPCYPLYGQFDEERKEAKRECLLFGLAFRHKTIFSPA